MIEEKYINMVIDQVDIKTVVEDLCNVTFTKRGVRYWCCCPFHEEDTPSFCVRPDQGTWHCFGSCNEGGNVIGFVMKKEGLPFPLAVKKLLKDYLHTDLKDVEVQESPEEVERRKKRESMLVVNDYACRFFREELLKDNAEAKAALGYATRRWGREYCDERLLGYAPNSWDTFVEWANAKALDLDLMVELGLLRKSEKSGKLYSFFRNRLMIPIRDRYNNITGWTARTLDEKEDRKYLNSCESDIYKKDQSVFGIAVAAKQARIEEKLYLVEGGPDVMKLQSVGVLNVVASLGGAWTKNQLEQLRRFNATLCFIPDSDNDKPEGKRPGELNVLKNGRLAIENGFTVTVKEIPNDTNKKMDPDSYIDSRERLLGMKEEEFILWMARKRWNDEASIEDRLALVNEICDMLVGISDENIQNAYLGKLWSKYGNRTEWIGALKSAKRRKLESVSHRNNKNGDIDMLRQFGFLERWGCYYGTDKNGHDVQWSNFTMKPLFHIKDDIRPVRLFEIDNDDEETPKEIIELDMEVFTSAKSLRKKLLGIGNYTWLADDNALIQLQRYLAKVTDTAIEIKQLGWQRQGFFCFCNGAQEDGQWQGVDRMGIVRLKAGKFYLPAMSQLYKDSTELFANERKFRHQTYSNFSLKEYFSKIVAVFGDNGKVGLCFYMATLFRDIVKPRARFFPLLNIFGPKGSGKTELAETLMTFFSTDNEPPNIETASVPSLADTVASVSNALVHLDEYKNGIDIKKIEWLKDIWGGIGRSRMNMDKDKKREQARVDSGVVITGQEMPTADIALFTRLIYLTYDRQHHTREERDRFSDLLRMRLMGATHITLEILRHRDSFEASFGNSWIKAEADVEYALKGEEITDRIERNWLVPLAALLSLKNVLDIPLDYSDVLRICVDGIRRQNKLCASADEVSGFWNIISSAQQKGILMCDQDYIIKTKTELSTNMSETKIEWEAPKQVLLIRKNIMLATYRQLGRQMDEHLLPSESILHYLQISPEYLGISKVPYRFRKFNANGQPMQEQIIENGSVKGFKTIYNQDRPLCFDYEMLSQKFGIILGSYIESVDNADSNSGQKEARQQEMDFDGDTDTSDYTDGKPF